MSEMLKLLGVSKHFQQRSRTVHVLREVDLSMAAHEIVALVGESGSGKSTLARLLMRLFVPDQGRIIFEGVDVSRIQGKALHAYRRNVQMLFQDPFASLNPAHTVQTALVRSLPSATRKSRALRMATIHDSLTHVGLVPPENFLSKYPHELSGGQRQRVAFSRALGMHPKLVLADEPVSMLDVSLRLDVLNLMRTLNTEQGLGYLYITHDLAGARYIASRILVMYAGEIIEEGPAEDVVDAAHHPYTQLLVAAAPDSDLHRRDTEKTRFVGEPPDLGVEITGCPFQFRCPHVMELCRRVHPPRTLVAAQHYARCHLYDVSTRPA